MNVLLHVLMADFRERTRSQAYLALVGVTVYLTYLFVPPLDADYVTVALGTRRGIYNAAWVGTMFGMAATVLLSLIAFYVVKNGLDRDYRTGVGRLVAATPVRTWRYLLGKWLSNLAVLSLLLVVLSVMGLVMQQVRGEATAIDVAALVTPIWLMGFPVMSVVASVALFFEAVPVLRSGAGNVAYFFLWVVVLGYSVTSGFTEGTFMQPSNDLFGLTVPVSHMQGQVLASDPGYEGDFSIGRSGFDEIQLFIWEGVRWPPAIVAGRLAWTAFGAVLALAAAIPFDRFNPARPGRAAAHRRSGRRRRLMNRLTAPPRAGWRKLIGWTLPVLQPLSRLIGSYPSGGVFLAEVRLNLSGRAWWWVVGLIALVVAGLTATDGQALADILSIAWIWPILVWSQLGTRESRHFTEALIFSAPRPLRRQLPAAWLAGVTVSLLAAGGVLGRLMIAGNIAHLAAVLVGAMFIPSLALALGVWSGTGRLFELVYLVWWYLLVNGSVPLDFMGLNEEALARGVPLFYFSLTGVLLLLGFIGRRRQIRRM